VVPLSPRHPKETLEGKVRWGEGRRGEWGVNGREENHKGEIKEERRKMA